MTLTSVAPGTHTYTATFVPLGLTHLGSESFPRSVTVQVGSTTGLFATASGRDVTLDVQVATDGGAPAGAVELRDGGVLVGTRSLVAGTASLTLAAVSPGDHTYRATFVPSEPASYVGSTSPVFPLTVASDPLPTSTAAATASPDPTIAPPPVATPSTSTTSIKAPRKAKAGTRPTITVSVKRGTAAAAGTVVVKMGKKSRTLTLEAGKAKLRLPRPKGRTVRITVRYLGNPTTSTSSARRTIKVVG